jgi:hypothetical protein
MAKRIRIRVGDLSLDATLNESASARLLYETLPSTISMTRWGDEFYGNCGVSVGLEPDAREEMEVGELAIWPDGTALCIFFGPTPASRGDEPRAISPVNPVGRIDGDTDPLVKLPAAVNVDVTPLD